MEMRMHKRFWSGNQNEEDNLGDLGEDGRKILK
jgi:hypothetical protein